MVIRYLSGIVAGLTIGVVLSEALLAGAGLLMPDLKVSSLLVGETTSDRTASGVVVMIYMLAIGFSATMATGIAGGSAGWICGILWLVPIFLLGSLSGMDTQFWGSLAIACLTGCLVGTRVALLIDRT